MQPTLAEQEDDLCSNLGAQSRANRSCIRTRDCAAKASQFKVCTTLENYPSILAQCENGPWGCQAANRATVRCFTGAPVSDGRLVDKIFGHRNGWIHRAFRGDSAIRRFSRARRS
jgi:hypothetical protein